MIVTSIVMWTGYVLSMFWVYFGVKMFAGELFGDKLKKRYIALFRVTGIYLASSIMLIILV